jgi:hypothetical protein
MDEQKIYIDEDKATLILSIAFHESGGRSLETFYLLITALLSFSQAIGMSREKLTELVAKAAATSYLIPENEVEAHKCQPN